MDNPQISIVAPLYNESETFPHLIQRLNALMDASPLSIEVVLIDDGSRDRTAELMQALALSDPRYHCVFLSRNHGHQLALSAGMNEARGTEAIMVIDGDLQDPPELLTDFYQLYKEGNDVVYAVRRKRKEGFIKRAGYHLFYRLLRSISYIEIPLDSGDFALVSRRVVDVMNKMPEESRYLRGMRTWVGFKQIGFEYERDERIAGESKYSFKQLFRLAYNGIFNFSEFPIKLLTRLGGTAIAFAMLYFIYNVIKKYVLGQEVPEGFPATLFTIIFFGGMNLFGLGIIGEYVLRIFFQSKGRPLFIIKSKIRNGNWE
ncbi:glycosyltransferase family 2 protein [Siphonobacter aquaeclarae]|uniref:Dolichol-phosphate mannosyltransferase n=1 Tax=Siphonobacter aquaeclarae TaxID=563176 RepID=A0A1G9QC70_9BACT|nr:glycosyltransferase family 2 protein [Siphonobacter aquaeclarae]MBO9638527.1 glycosyltransferase family 2 protein [Siphonobacter aquaeclarae]SDM08057.1 dolichol-phosphate mannosyltransferase [Siphonobacter aquaeclarae]